MVYYRLRSLGHKVTMEYQITDGQIDVMDFTTKILYEIQGNMNKELIQQKADKYLKAVGGIDMVPIPLSSFSDWDLKSWNKRLDKFIIQ